MASDFNILWKCEYFPQPFIWYRKMYLAKPPSFLENITERTKLIAETIAEISA